MSIRHLAFATVALLVPGLARGDTPAGLTPDERDRIDREVKELGDRIEALRRPAKPPARDVTGFLPDAEVFRKAVIWALRYEPKLEPADVALIHKALEALPGAGRGPRGRQDAVVAPTGEGRSAGSSRPWTARCSPTA